MEKLNVAIAGCHRMVTKTLGSHNFAAALHSVAETNVVAVFDFEQMVWFELLLVPLLQVG